MYLYNVIWHIVKGEFGFFYIDLISISVGLVDIEDINPKSSGEKWPEILVTCKEVVGIQEQRVTMSW